jgi:hypothetical protein
MIIIDSIMSSRQVCNLQFIRNYSNYNIIKFQVMLSYELWDDAVTNDNVNNIFNAISQFLFKHFLFMFY